MIEIKLLTPDELSASRLHRFCNHQENHMQNETITAEQLKAIAMNPEMHSAIMAARDANLASLPPMPPMPEGVPDSFIGALFYPGGCAIPLWSGDRWRFMVMIDGASIRDSRDNSFVMFDEYEEAMTQVNGYIEHLRRTPPTKD